LFFCQAAASIWVKVRSLEIAETCVRENAVRPRHRADLDRKDIGEAHPVIVAQEHQLPGDLGEASGRRPCGDPCALLETEDGAVRRVLVEDPGVAGFIEMRDAALLIKPGVQFPGGGQLDELARHDEHQFAARLQVADAFLDEEQEQVAARVEEVGFQLFPGVDRNILEAHVGRVADDGVELLGQRVIEKVADLDSIGRDPGVDFEADTVATPCPQRREERASHPPTAPARARCWAHKIKHEFDHARRREHLAELFDVARHHGV
jgi:hypothetical protein